jgi:hypothetical protein
MSTNTSDNVDAGKDIGLSLTVSLTIMFSTLKRQSIYWTHSFRRHRASREDRGEFLPVLTFCLCIPDIASSFAGRS